MSIYMNIYWRNSFVEKFIFLFQFSKSLQKFLSFFFLPFYSDIYVNKKNKYLR